MNRSFLLASTKIPVSGIDLSSSSRLHINNVSGFPLHLEIRENLEKVFTFSSLEKNNLRKMAQMREKSGNLMSPGAEFVCCSTRTNRVHWIWWHVCYFW